MHALDLFLKSQGTCHQNAEAIPVLSFTSISLLILGFYFGITGTYQSYQDVL